MKYISILLFFAFTITVNADTTTIRIHDHTDMTWYGNYDEWGVLPDSSKTYRKIYLHYTMGCASNGCSDWDYTTKIEVRHRTGKLDSALQSHPNFTVNGSSVDTIYFSLYPIYTYTWDSINNILDSVLSTSMEIILFNDPNNPTSPSDTILAWEAGINTFNYDSLGQIIDTTFIYADSNWIATYYNWYNVFEVIEPYELARIITPYGSYLQNNWEFTHTFDITDYVNILRDSVEIRAHYSGWSSGFSATLDFEFIEGIPPRKVLNIENIYKGSYSYTNSSNFETTKLYPKKFRINNDADYAMVKMITTGHGFDNNINAAEFKPIDYYLKVDGQLTHTQYNWDNKCGENPIYPQGGTWIYDRANWCPGTKAEAFDHEITPYITAGDSIELNIDFQSYVWSGSQTPSYIIDCQLFQYEMPGSTNFNNSVEIIDIIKPSEKDVYSRKNPICSKPLIKVRNYGTTPLTSFDIEYEVIGGVTHTHQWSGNLKFLETTEIELPTLSNWSGSSNVFKVTLLNPNGMPDDYPDNNTMETSFQETPEYPNSFAVWVGTNNGVINSLTQVSETSWDILDDQGNVVVSSGVLYGNSQYRDTITLSNGCYTFIMHDTDEDGLEFWANNDGGGMVRFRQLGASWLKIFDPDFGTNIIHEFTVGYAQSITNEEIEKVEVYPNLMNENVTIDFVNHHPETDLVLMDNIGKVILEIPIKEQGSISRKINVSNLSKGIYYLKIDNIDNNPPKKIVKL
ncbi:MAG: peptide-N-glycosidase F-related protein [Bacteroidota bacterium]|nr:peptide-N-glycosidase F-related protein [Bacteroidota bacterium]